MDPVSMPEWFTAFAEISAVVVALFLPQYQAYRERKTSFARMRRVTKGMLQALARDRAACKGGCDPSKLESAKELDLYLQVAFLVLSDQRELDLREEVAGLYRELTSPHADVDAVERKIALL